jgi:hypothetical protein
MQGFWVYFGITFIFWIGLFWNLYDYFANGHSIPPKTLSLLLLMTVGFTIFWTAIGGFGSSNFAPSGPFRFID